MNPIFTAALEVQEFCRTRGFRFCIEGVVLRQHARLDEGLIWQELLPLLELKEDSQTEARLRRLVEQPTA